MKCRVLTAVLIAALMGIFLPSTAQKNYFVVVGAFSTDENEADFTTHLPKTNSDTAYAMSDHDKVVHLYVLKTGSEALAVERSVQLQKSIEELNNKSVVPGNYESVSISKIGNLREITFKTETHIEGQNASGPEASASKESGPHGAAAVAPSKSASTVFKFTIADPNGQQIPGQIHFVDFKREKDLATYATSDYTHLINPGTSGDMALVCGIFGYKQTEKHIQYTSPELIEGAYLEENGAWVIPYDLVRLEKGDVSVMYNVTFHKNSVIMLPPSKTDLDELVKMMKENLNYEITIHGHCNGKMERRITTHGPTGDVFDIRNAQRLTVSAKTLSNFRAHAIKNYLIKEGINSNRIRTFAWGGRYMLVDPESSYSALNDRIEIEIRKD